ncbi:thioredoxin peroxidase [Aliivibrio fischeri ES114]|uniref:Thioredoxin peroxidase n=1 Tax=Aliivibrio fischeri (strain ATCC 700601 / ES114) TaxID=312309 RepID=Q5DZ36_ALIF1|nr:peroxiredoxin [Aliivibrio fischeri]AAW87960.1 thioredoxin peroxidase [Aliivibrio fischeri ES114]KLU80446.1 thioredoxin peroxidase [Aliivibrio fischeri]
MKKITLLIGMLLSTSVFAEKQFEITQKNAAFGTQQTVTLENKVNFNLSGNAIKVGDYFPSIELITSNLQSFDTSESGRVKIYSLLTSIDTPVCVQQAIDLAKFTTKHSNMNNGIEFYAISADTPFAQQRFINKYNLNGLKFLSDSIEHNFGKETGAQIKELGLLTRSIIVVDKNNKIAYYQRVPELTTIPDLNKAVNIAKTLI